MYQIQARVLYGNTEGDLTKTIVMPTFYLDFPLSIDCAKNAADMLNPSKDENIVVNMTVRREISWYGVDIRAQFEQDAPPFDQAQIPPLEAFQSRGGRTEQVG